MQHKHFFTNARGENFTILFEEPSVPVSVEADFWGFVYVVTDSKNLKRAFRLMIKKSFIKDRKQAVNFSRDLPLKTLHGLLENYQSGNLPLFFPDVSKGWEVF
jgi:hypothetical protein